MQTVVTINYRKTTRFACLLSNQPGTTYLWEHRVAGRALLPGAAMFELAYAAGASHLGAYGAPVSFKLTCANRTFTIYIMLNNNPRSIRHFSVTSTLYRFWSDCKESNNDNTHCGICDGTLHSNHHRSTIHGSGQTNLRPIISLLAGEEYRALSSVTDAIIPLPLLLPPTSRSATSTALEVIVESNSTITLQQPGTSRCVLITCVLITRTQEIFLPFSQSFTSSQQM